MAFTSIQFIFVFLPIFLIIYFLLPRKWKNLWLFAGSLCFYAVSAVDKPQYILLLILSVIVNFLFGKSIEKSDKPKFLLTIGIAYNLLWLCVFKYADFIFENINFYFGKTGRRRAASASLKLIASPRHQFLYISEYFVSYRRIQEGCQSRDVFCRFWSIPDYVPQTDHGTYSPV